MRRGRIAATVLTLAVLGGIAFVVLFLGGQTGLGPARGATPPGVGDQADPPDPPPSTCPLSGLEAEGGAVPDRPALAVKVENLPAARPQTGMSWADIVYEEPVEALITRFIAVYQCQDASRIEPVRSARLTDVSVLTQFGRPVFAYAGAVPKVDDAVESAGFVAVTEENHLSAFDRDPDREPPHDLTTSTQALYEAAGDPTGYPDPVFSFARKGRPKGVPVSELHLPFSQFSDVYWRWNAAEERFHRWHGSEQHTYADGTPVDATNIVVQVVRIEYGEIKDVNGALSPEVVSVGSGKAYVLRGGRIVEGTWTRKSLSDVTRFVDAGGKEIKLLRGQTWVELFPSTLPVEYS